ncbi:uncharacterized protein [Trachinotus anak]|uniref:uncharacterized protein isoform X1 n=1 Tax=Trachinotus anak TaxID=443729 RepID=UPI0039F18B3E
MLDKTTGNSCICTSQTKMCTSWIPWVRLRTMTQMKLHHGFVNNHYSQYFNMQQNRHQKTDWVGVKWQPATINHSIQKDGYSCGVFVMKIAEDVVEAFPLVPQNITIPMSQKGLKDLRINMAKTILQCSVFSEKDHCSSCGQEYPKGQTQTTKWIECTKCRRWYHPRCVTMSDAEWDEENTTTSSKWQCGLC